MPRATIAIFGILGLMLCFGVVTLAGGIGQVGHDRSNRCLVETILCWRGPCW